MGLVVLLVGVVAIASALGLATWAWFVTVDADVDAVLPFIPFGHAVALVEE